MSGIYARTRYDNCAEKEYASDSKESANYWLEQYAAVNPSFKNNKQVVCADQKNGCKRFQDSDATMNLGSESFGKRIDVEENLRGTNRILSRCLSGKHYPCDLQDAPNRLPGECDNVITVNPWIYERDIAPTNMTREWTKGW